MAKAKKPTRYSRVAIGLDSLEAEDRESLQIILADVGCAWKDKITGEVVSWTFGTMNIKHIAAACAYGLAKLGEDRTSSVDEDGKLRAREELIEFFKYEEWSKPRAAGAPTVSAEVEALAELRCKGSVARAQQELRKYTKEERVQILASPEVVKLADQIKGRREEMEVDFSDMLS
jgi:hypothetical protein